MILWTRLVLFTLVAGSTGAVDPRWMSTVPQALSPADACEDFEENDLGTPSWSLADCQEVWTQWMNAIPPHNLLGYMDRNLLQRIGDDFRREGSGCFVQLPKVVDGIGSAAIRSIITWMFAEEIRCSWVVPDLGKRQTDEKGRAKYCHGTATLKERENMTPEEKRQAEGENCIYVNWLQYFGFDRYSVPLPEQGVAKTVVFSPGKPWFRENLETLRGEVDEALNKGSGHLPWDYLLITFDNAGGSTRCFLSSNTWDLYKRRNTQHIRQKLKEAFFGTQSQITRLALPTSRAPGAPQPLCCPDRFDAYQNCGFDKTRLNFGIHIRMGDRRQFMSADTEYFHLLDAFMDTVTARVEDLGLSPPLFHVFSETSVPCPPRDTAVFEEFSAWPPVETSQIETCWNAVAPTNCPEKEAGLLFTCRSPRSGVFRLEGKPVVLHVGKNAVEAMSCMTHADGILMGCSTFGQIAGILTEGISFFSLRCGGEMTPDQYQLIPPMALADRGTMWVPVDGSWRDPVLWSEEILVEALVKLVERKESLAK